MQETQGIALTVTTQWCPERSDPDSDHSTFIYRVTVQNRRPHNPIQIISHHWDILGASFSDIEGNDVWCLVPRGTKWTDRLSWIRGGESMSFVAAVSLSGSRAEDWYLRGALRIHTHYPKRSQENQELSGRLKGIVVAETGPVPCILPR